ncbi:histidine triad nucleotide-binding protein [Knoellia subterranea]|uniref:Histidine triad (HIT) protein n=1 Tax=Knoellia subterranea KCTC 19937 TaxID=1385521 RepID=A0A0A0JNT9_9MICO|nr:histidine triad nucleotide-binding protein [Knoellia subterranea]KGN39060.1 histidine triad (HIT) protein [Knoellia subterranea KCTC 19937]
MSEAPTPSDCLFCRFVSREIEPDVVAETDRSLAFRDINPQAPTHVLVVPKRHVENAGALAVHAEELADVVSLARDVAAAEGLDGGYRLVFNTGAEAGQTVFHAHLHVLGGRSMQWPPG